MPIDGRITTKSSRSVICCDVIQYLGTPYRVVIQYLESRWLRLIHQEVVVFTLSYWEVVVFTLDYGDTHQ